ncbi:hypothetical protein NDU88_004643 [Pleurodeles waltl]|uniref:Uncharacterized protein n=1 Tax=Pleurodeles waltl TaxID=8319 RepID=A0AAV7TU65_PLEWA|nr:hypothetical protein NDU88_004643 [Pleurodeles waltl]
MPRGSRTGPLIVDRADERCRSRNGLKEDQDGPSGSEARGCLSGYWAGRRRRDQTAESGSRSGPGEERSIWDIIRAYGCLGAPRPLEDMQ